MTTKALRFFAYFGAKQVLGLQYPPPEYPLIIEPFAGSAGYACCYPDRNVWLFDKDPKICGVWDYLIKTPAQEIFQLPDILPGESVDDFQIPQEAKWLIGFWLDTPCAHSRKTMSSIGRYKTLTADPTSWLGAKKTLAQNVSKIRHWKVSNLGYEAIEYDGEATWFIDPPYFGRAGTVYTHGSKKIDYGHLGAWCQARKGQVMVCEMEGAEWLPFRTFKSHGVSSVAAGRVRSTQKRYKEVLWTNAKIARGTNP